MSDQNTHLQQEAIGVLGVNMVYACYKYTDNLSEFVQSLVDGIKGRVELDMVRLNGDDFKHIDNRILSLYAVKYGLTDVAIFDENGFSKHASEFLWKKDLMIVRGHFRPPTKVTVDVFDSAYKQFINEPDVEVENATVIAEITLDYLSVNGEISDQDFLDRTDTLCALGHNVIISNCPNHQNLIHYLSDHKIGRLSLVIGVRELSGIIDEKYSNNTDGRILVAFGELFNKNITVYIYPAYFEKGGELINAKTLIVPDGIHFLYKHLIDAQQIVEIENYDKELLDIMPWNVLESIEKDDGYWEKAVPQSLVQLVKDKKLFNYGVKSANLA